MWSWVDIRPASGHCPSKRYYRRVSYTNRISCFWIAQLESIGLEDAAHLLVRLGSLSCWKHPLRQQFLFGVMQHFRVFSRIQSEPRSLVCEKQWVLCDANCLRPLRGRSLARSLTYSVHSDDSVPHVSGFWMPFWIILGHLNRLGNHFVHFFVCSPFFNQSPHSLTVFIFLSLCVTFRNPKWVVYQRQALLLPGWSVL